MRTQAPFFQGPHASLGWVDYAARPVTIMAGPSRLRGDLSIPAKSIGLVVFVHGSGSGRRSPRNEFVAYELCRAGIATLLVDMLTRDEEQLDPNATAPLDIPRLAQRLAGIRRWIANQPGIRHLPVGYFAASTGAAIAITAAAKQPDSVAAIVARGGRLDLANTVIDAVQAPTLLIVGGDDVPVLRINRHGYERLRCVKEIHVVHGATHLLEEPGALEEVARLASDWFTKYLRGLPERENA